MDLTLVRNATLLVETGGRRLLVDPSLDPAGARPPIANTPHPRPNPLVDLPLSGDAVVARVAAVRPTPPQPANLDDTAVAALGPRLPVACQPVDEPVLREGGFR